MRIHAYFVQFVNSLKKYADTFFEYVKNSSELLFFLNFYDSDKYNKYLSCFGQLTIFEQIFESNILILVFNNSIALIFIN